MVLDKCQQQYDQCDRGSMSKMGIFSKQENQVGHEVQQYKMKPAENGQPEHKTQREEMSLALG